MPDSSSLQSYAKLLKLVPVGDEQFVAPKAEESPGKPASKGWRHTGNFVLVALLIILPTVAAGVYYAFLATNRYESEARFVIRMPGRTSAQQLTSILESTGIGRSTDDAYIVRDYMLSRDAVANIDSSTGLAAAYGRGGRDILWRFPNLFSPNNREGLYRHYLRMISVAFDATSGVTTLTVQAFDAKDARRITIALLDTAEGLVNRLNERARKDAIALAESEVKRMEQRMAVAQADLTAFRNRESMIDPGQATFFVLEGIAKLSGEAAQLSMQLRELQTISPQSPQMGTLRARLASTEAQIAIERRKLAGDSESVSSKIAAFEKLVLEREFSERALFAALGAVELARVEAQRQQSYLERVAEPSSPDHPSNPYRGLWCIVVAVVGYMTFRIVRIAVSNLRKHASA